MENKSVFEYKVTKIGANISLKNSNDINIIVI